MSKCIKPNKPVDNEGDNRWTSHHNRLLSETKEKEPDVVLIGDQIIHDLALRPIWDDLFEPLHSLNLGIANDRTENVLYRIQDGVLDNIKPKVVIVHVGTCNINDAVDEVGNGIIQIVEEIQTRLPQAYVIVLEILPRGQSPNALREKNDRVNEYIRQQLSSMERVELVAASKTLVQADGTISHHDMPDYLSLTEAAYRKIFEPIYEEVVLQLFGENKDKSGGGVENV